MQKNKRSFNAAQTLFFMLVLALISGLTLSVIAFTLKNPQEKSRQLYKNKQLLIAAKILSYRESFILPALDDHVIPARYDEKTGILIPSSKEKTAKDALIEQVATKRLEMRLTDSLGQLYTFDELEINQYDYLQMHEKTGYANLPYKLVYIISQNNPDNTPLPYGYVLPINGYGLWGKIYGYLGLKADANTILAITWYKQQETPGLGGDISLPKWQKQFQGKQIFQQNDKGVTLFQIAPLGIRILKPGVKETLNSFALQSSVDGIAGASATMRGVSQALNDSLTPYRPFLIWAHNRFLQTTQGS